MRSAVDAMPRYAREAMLRGLDGNAIIAGAYADPRTGGICPMLAAHRNGGRTNLSSFARCWDRYTGARRPRLATERELRVLRTYLEMSLVADETGEQTLAAIAAEIRTDRDEFAAIERATPEPSFATDADALDFDFAISERSRELRAEPSLASEPDRESDRRPTGERSRIAELRDRAGWGWTAPTTSYEVYKQRIAAAEQALSEGRAAELLSDGTTDERRELSAH